MLLLFGVLVILASIILGIIVLIQNPKGGGLTSSLGGFGNQFMGVKRTTDILEKGTWIFAGIIGFLCIASSVFIPKNGGVNSRENLIQQAPAGTPLTVPQGQTAPLTPAPSSQQTPPAPQP